MCDIETIINLCECYRFGLQVQYGTLKNVLLYFVSEKIIINEYKSLKCYRPLIFTRT